MITTILLVLLLALAAACFIGRARINVPEPIDGKDAYDRRDRQKEIEAAENFRGGTLIAGVVLAVIAIVWAALASTVIVGANEVGVPVAFGKAGQPQQSGLHVNAPWVDVETLPTRPDTVTTDANVRTGESGHAKVVIAARWSTDRSNARELYLQVRTGDDDKIRDQIVIPQIQGAAGQFYGGHRPDRAGRLRLHLLERLT